MYSVLMPTMGVSRSLVLGLLLTLVNSRELQVANYKGSYVATFQHLMEGVCRGNDPIIQVYCDQVDPVVTSVSHPEILCGDDIIDGGLFRGIECTVNCTNDPTCQERIFRTDQVIGTGAEGQIFFDCEGDSLFNADAAASYVAGEPGLCGNSVLGQNRNFHAINLGVLCPTEQGGMDYIVDDYYSECGNEGFPIPGDGNPGDRYSCAIGNNCFGEVCEIEFTDIFVNADVEYIAPDGCVQTNVPVPAPTFVEPGPSILTFRSEYEVGFGLFFDETSAETCSGNFPQIEIHCPLGEIARIDTSRLVTCTKTDAETLECTGVSGFISETAEVVYSCTGPVVQESTATFRSQQAFCEGNVLPAKVSHYLQLGVYCEFDGVDPDYFYSDVAFECGEVGHQFHIRAEDANDARGRYSCVESATFPAGSTESDMQTIAPVRVITDLTFLDNPLDQCQTISRVVPQTIAPAPLPTTTPTTAPMSAPTNPPVAGVVTTNAPVGTPTRSPVRRPTPAPDVPIVTPRGSSSSSSSSSIGPIIGGVVGAIALVCVASLLAWRMFLNRPADGSSVKIVQEHTDHQNSTEGEYTGHSGGGGGWTRSVNSVSAEPLPAPVPVSDNSSPPSSMTTDPQPVHVAVVGLPTFKGQAMSVVDPALNASHNNNNNNNNRSSLRTASDVPTNELPIVSAVVAEATTVSNTSANTRRSAEPAGDYMGDP